jgi:hypothetical protein
MIRAAFPLALLLSALPALAQDGPLICQKGQSQREDDKETGAVIQKTKVIPRADHFDPLLVWTSDEPGSVMFAVLGNSPKSRYANCSGLNLVVDGRSLVLSKPKHEQEAGGDRVVEYLTADITWGEAEKIAYARSIRYKICNDEFQAPPDFVCQARDVIDAATAWRKAAAGKKGPGGR